jgi:transposase
MSDLNRIFHCRMVRRGLMIRRSSCSGVIFVVRNGLRWRDVPAEYGPPKKIYKGGALMIDGSVTKATTPTGFEPPWASAR